jgi:hypothetical protein
MDVLGTTTAALVCAQVSLPMVSSHLSGLILPLRAKLHLARRKVCTTRSSATLPIRSLQ